ncbi:hypothetical protein, partial [Enterococcus faecalis]|uniref:hypothetical protein n=1 Tax=Enterococcus faecalis TaxID=1351 RepID=UPI00403F9382
VAMHLKWRANPPRFRPKAGIGIANREDGLKRLCGYRVGIGIEVSEGQAIKPLRLVILGVAGRMGRELVKAAADQGCTVVGGT